MLTDSYKPGKYLATNANCIGGATMSDYFTVALASFPWGHDNSYETCSVDWTWLPTWMA